MKVVILGAGVIGVTAAYMLGSRGHEVEVIERQAESARETSFANGGQLSFSHAEPWANPGTLSKIGGWLFKEDSPLFFRPRADLDMVLWGLRFLANCTENKAKSTTATHLKLGLYSKKVLEKIRVYSGVEFDNRREGILHIFSNQKSFDQAIIQSRYQEKLGCKAEVLDNAGCIRVEPALAHAGRPIIGGIYESLDESGDAFAFTQKLAELCAKEFKTVFHYNTEVKKIACSGDKVTGIVTDRNEVKGDAYVMSLGSYSPLYLRQLNIRVPIYPMKGYSITFPANHYSPHVSLTDAERKIVYSRLGNTLRIAGTAEFAGYNTDIISARIAPIVRAVKELLPQCNYDAPQSEWACLRPSTPDGPPIIGKTAYSNFFMNTGHGTLGWTQAAGSAALLADIMENRPTEISLNGLTADRF